MKLPAHVYETGLRAAEGATICGVRLSDLTRDELISVAALGWKLYNEQLGISIETRSRQRELTGMGR